MSVPRPPARQRAPAGQVHRVLDRLVLGPPHLAEPLGPPPLLHHRPIQLIYALQLLRRRVPEVCRGGSWSGGAASGSRGLAAPRGALREHGRQWQPGGMAQNRPPHPVCCSAAPPRHHGSVGSSWQGVKLPRMRAHPSAAAGRAAASRRWGPTACTTRRSRRGPGIPTPWLTSAECLLPAPRRGAAQRRRRQPRASGSLCDGTAAGACSPAAATALQAVPAQGAVQATAWSEQGCADGVQRSSRVVFPQCRIAWMRCKLAWCPFAALQNRDTCACHHFFFSGRHRAPVRLAQRSPAPSGSNNAAGARSPIDRALGGTLHAGRLAIEH